MEVKRREANYLQISIKQKVLRKLKNTLNPKTKKRII